jgi:2-amino-4-hydroxy-6-hydroxymethyldihydropteridine diphosphokinase
MILINVGSNLDSTKGDRFYNIKKSLESMKLEKIKIIKISSVYETPSYPNEKNPKFLNIGLEVQCSHTPKELIKKFNKIEKKLQRVRGAKNQPRTCDIDLIDYDGKILNSKKLTIPHPKAHLRNFVLFPIKEISSSWIHPTLNKRIDFLIKKLSFKLRNEITRIKEHVTIE